MIRFNDMPPPSGTPEAYISEHATRFMRWFDAGVVDSDNLLGSMGLVRSTLETTASTLGDIHRTLAGKAASTAEVDDTTVFAAWLAGRSNDVASIMVDQCAAFQTALASGAPSASADDLYDNIQKLELALVGIYDKSHRDLLNARRVDISGVVREFLTTLPANVAEACAKASFAPRLLLGPHNKEFMTLLVAAATMTMAARFTAEEFEAFFGDCVGHRTSGLSAEATGHLTRAVDTYWLMQGMVHILHWERVYDCEPGNLTRAYAMVLAGATGRAPPDFIAGVEVVLRSTEAAAAMPPSSAPKRGKGASGADASSTKPGPLPGMPAPDRPSDVPHGKSGSSKTADHKRSGGAPHAERGSTSGAAGFGRSGASGVGAASTSIPLPDQSAIAAAAMALARQRGGPPSDTME